MGYCPNRRQDSIDFNGLQGNACHCRRIVKTEESRICRNHCQDGFIRARVGSAPTGLMGRFPAFRHRLPEEGLEVPV